jgi:hypothetical protein
MLVAACGALTDLVTGDRAVDRRLAGSIGMSGDAVLARFGKPITDEMDASGRRVLTFYRSSTTHVGGAYAQVAQQQPVDCSQFFRPISCQKVEVKDGKDTYRSTETETVYVDGAWVPAHLDVWWCSLTFSLGRDGKVMATDFSRYSADQKIDCNAVPWPEA